MLPASAKLLHCDSWKFVILLALTSAVDLVILMPFRSTDSSGWLCYAGCRQPHTRELSGLAQAGPDLSKIPPENALRLDLHSRRC